MGYSRAGFDVVGVDIKPQPHYPFEFVQGDALEWLAAMRGDARANFMFDAIHASPPCQGYANVTLWRGNQENHERLIEPVRELLQATGLPWVIENVRTTALHDPVMLCGTWLGLKVIRHRYFESNWGLPMRFEACDHSDCLVFEHKYERTYANAMGCDWMTNVEARQAIPPAYTDWIGWKLMASLKSDALVAGGVV